MEKTVSIDWIEKMKDYLDDVVKYGVDKANGKWQMRVREIGVWVEFDGDLSVFNDPDMQIEQRPYGYTRAGIFVSPISPEYPPEQGSRVFVPHPYSVATAYVMDFPYNGKDQGHRNLLFQGGMFASKEEAVTAIKADIQDRMEKLA